MKSTLFTFRAESFIPARRCGLFPALILSAAFLIPLTCRLCGAASIAELPNGVEAVWDVAKASAQTTATRQRMCINGLWGWQPAKEPAGALPTEEWGWFKVPGCWPGISDYMQKDAQTVYPNAAWKEQNFSSATAAWYQRDLFVPAEWDGRRIALSIEYLNSLAAVFIDGKKAGEIQFPAGEVDLSSVVQPGHHYTLSILVVAVPLKGVIIAYRDSEAARQIKGSVARRGLCGDVFLTSTPAGPRLGETEVTTSVRTSQIAFTATLDRAMPKARYSLHAEISQGGKRVADFASKPFTDAELKKGTFSFEAQWKPQSLWDIHTPANQYDVGLSLLDDAGRVIDTTYPVRFGFRELWIDGRDFYLNGSRLFLCAVPLTNAQISAGLATYDAARETLLRLKSSGINFVYTENYDCEPGSHLSFEEILRAADDVGVLVSLSQPHFSGYDWSAKDAVQTNGYARHAAFYAHVAGSHPSVVFYAMSHNATGYDEDMNPDLIDGVHDRREQWSLDNAKRALEAEAIVRGLDPSRIVYHHASGNLGSMHSVNFYPNFAPIQELSDWFAHWSTTGVKPLFLCEYAAPFTWDWTLYRGWYKGQREFGSALVPWDFCLAEWDAQFLGDRAFDIGEAEKANIRWESQQFREGKTWHRWDYPTEVGSARFEDRQEVLARYVTDNWRAFRTWGVSAVSPWDYGHFWKLRDGVDKTRKALKTDWQNLQRPGYSPDFVDQQFDRMDVSYDRADWVETPAAKALLRNNQPVLAYLGGGPKAFTGKGHNFIPGEQVERQIIVVNNSRRTITCQCNWSVDLPTPLSGTARLTGETGNALYSLIRFEFPRTTPPGKYNLKATVRFDDGQTQDDSFTLDVLPPPPPAVTLKRFALFDPKGETASLLDRLNMSASKVDATADLSAVDTLIIGKGSLSVDGPAPDLSRVRKGLKVIVFEQAAEVLEKRLGFRAVEYGLRQVFKRIPNHPVLAGIEDSQLSDWRGEARLTSPRLQYELRSQHGPTVRWCDRPVSRVWRCGNRGNVASVIIEKPARGDFLPIVDGGFSLQYCPMMEYREGAGMILFCQLDVTGRDEDDPAGLAIAGNLLRYAADWKPAPRRTLLYAGVAAGRKHLESAGFTPVDYDASKLKESTLLVIGPGGSQNVAGDKAALAEFLRQGGRLLCIKLNQQEANAFLPFAVETKQTEHLGAPFDVFRADSPFAGTGPADLNNRDPREFPLVTGGLNRVGDGILAASPDGRVVLCQIAPWEFDPAGTPNVKRTFRRSAFLLTRILSNLGAESSTELLDRVGRPIMKDRPESRWLDGLYLDQPQEWDDPYRFFRW